MLLLLQVVGEGQIKGKAIVREVDNIVREIKDRSNRKDPRMGATSKKCQTKWIRSREIRGEVCRDGPI